MPISQVTNGLILWEDFDSYPNGFTFILAYFQPFYMQDNAMGSAGLDTTYKHTGTGSFYDYFMGAPGGTTVTWGMGLLKNLDVGSGSGRVARIWHKLSNSMSENYALAIAKSLDSWYYSWYCTTPDSETTHDWRMESCSIPDSVTGVQTCVVALSKCTNYNSMQAWADHLIICGGTTVTMTGLIPGQKVAICRSSDNTLIDTETCQAGQTSVALNVTAEDFPEQMYVKVYGADGATLIETTTSYQMCGGDVWNWFSGTGPITVQSNVFVIYRQAAAGIPRKAVITATLKTNGGAPYANQTLLFSTSLGSLTASSAVTDSNGQAQVQVQSATHGIAVIQVQWLGDANAAAGSAYCVVEVFYDAENPDATQDFQFYIQGIQYVYDRSQPGTYAWNAQGLPETFQVVIPQWVSAITSNGLVSIYRKGVKEFLGVLATIERSLSDAPQVTLSGPDISRLLDTRVVQSENYSTKTPQYIINDLLTKYPCGITAGQLGTCAATLTITIDTETLRAAIQRICSAVNWNFRVNIDLTLDFAEDFTGGLSSASFTEGVNILNCKRTQDYTTVANWVRMKGSGIVSMKQDGAMIQQQGLLQAPAFQKTVTDQTTLDTMCQANLDYSKTTIETIPLEAVDEYSPGTFATESQITVTSPTLGLLGRYTIKSITRDMTDPTYVKFELENRTPDLWTLNAAYQRMTKDASV
jgi:hypothetical protein